MSAFRLTLAQVHYVNKAFWRNPSRAFFTFAFPLMFLVIFLSLLGGGTELIGAVRVKQSTYYVASMGTFAVITACYNNIAIGMSYERDTGILKRIDGSPLPKGAFLVARVLHSLLVAVLLIVLTAAFGRLAYGANIPGGTALLRFLLMLVIGAVAFCALGLAITAAVPNADASAPIVNATILPLLFLSGIFIPFGDNTPSWVLWVARIFPVKHFGSGMLAAFVGTPFDWTDVVVVAAWGAAGMLLAARFFSWLPRTGA